MTPEQIEQYVYEHMTYAPLVQRAAETRRSDLVHVVMTSEFGFGDRPPVLRSDQDFDGPFIDGWNSLSVDAIDSITKGLQRSSYFWDKSTGSKTVVLLSGVFNYTIDGKTYVSNDAITVCEKEVYRVSKLRASLCKFYLQGCDECFSPLNCWSQY